MAMPFYEKIASRNLIEFAHRGLDRLSALYNFYLPRLAISPPDQLNVQIVSGPLADISAAVR